MYIIPAILMIAVICILISEWEKTHLKSEHYSFGNGEHRTRLIFIADLHNDFHNGKLYKKIISEKPDAVLIGGDVITCWKERTIPLKTEKAVLFLSELAKNFPVIYGEGNHECRFERRFKKDYEKYTTALKENGVTYLKNGSAKLSGTDISVYGLSMDRVFFDHNDPTWGAKQEYMSDTYISDRIGKPSDDTFNILLMHHPLYLNKGAAWGADLVLSAHYHGGTIWLGKKFGGLMTPQYGFFVKECQGVFLYKDGRNVSAKKDNAAKPDTKDAGAETAGQDMALSGSTKAKNTFMLVNRGIGTHSIKIRFMNRPEISVIDIYT